MLCHVGRFGECISKLSSASSSAVATSKMIWVGLLVREYKRRSLEHLASKKKRSGKLAKEQ